MRGRTHMLRLYAREHTYAQIICSMLVPRVPCLKPMSAIMPLPRPLSSDILRKPLLLAVACINKKGGVGGGSGYPPDL